MPYIVLGGADWFKEMGPEGSPGPCMYSLSGRVANPGQYEAPMGTTLRELLELAGGMSRGKELKFWTPGGSSTPMFTAEHLDVPLDFDSAVDAGSMNGTSALMIFDEDDCVVRAVKKWCEFYLHESCGKCTPCREGTYWYVGIYQRLEAGGGTAGGHRHPARPVRQHPGPLVLRARRRRHQPGQLVHPVLPRGVPRPRRRRRVPVPRRARPGWSPLMTRTDCLSVRWSCVQLTTHAR